METDVWWNLIGTARAAVGDRADDRNPPDDPLPDALIEVLSTLTPAEIIDFSILHVQVRDSAYQYPLWAAAGLIEGGCGDDGFIDFRDGLMLLGHDTFTRAIADPDTLAEHPVVRRMADDDGWIGYESLSYLVEDAYQKVQGETESYYAAVEQAMKSMTRPARPTGENWDPRDDAETARRLPRLAAIFLTD